MNLLFLSTYMKAVGEQGQKLDHKNTVRDGVCVFFEEDKWTELLKLMQIYFMLHLSDWFFLSFCAFSVEKKFIRFSPF
jgi:hypothetical protein